MSKRRGFFFKLSVGALFICILIGGSMNIAFANQDIGSLLTSWFDKKKNESITRIEETIAIEQEKQTSRLKEELQVKLKDSEQKLKEFTDTEIEARLLELKRYTDELIQNTEFSSEVDKEEFLVELDTIVELAKQQMVEMGDRGVSDSTGE
ncbi:hypothetical protein [Sutcliffiella halmapala]|uniref:hypothetical protein n=1 Tax=Sutcliffiella halmapala TaxID=79882 RepID=UPI000995A160|nr:hypothetical protein [Sutcliffiella halmapala]